MKAILAIIIIVLTALGSTGLVLLAAGGNEIGNITGNTGIITQGQPGSCLQRDGFNVCSGQPLSALPRSLNDLPGVFRQIRGCKPGAFGRDNCELHEDAAWAAVRTDGLVLFLKPGGYDSETVTGRGRNVDEALQHLAERLNAGRAANGVILDRMKTLGR